MWFKVNLKKLAVWLLATYLRRSKHVAWLQACIEPLIYLQDATLYKMQHSGQVIYLEKVLNEWFNIEGYNPDLHRESKKVFITDAFVAKRTYIYQTHEQKPVYLGKTYLYNENDLTAEYYDFIVNIPKELTYAENEIKALINYYKLAGKKYKIERY